MCAACQANQKVHGHSDQVTSPSRFGAKEFWIVLVNTTNMAFIKSTHIHQQTDLHLDQ